MEVKKTRIFDKWGTKYSNGYVTSSVAYIFLTVFCITNCSGTF